MAIKMFFLGFGGAQNLTPVNTLLYIHILYVHLTTITHINYAYNTNYVFKLNILHTF